MATLLEKVQELRERTGAGILDCKKALTETGEDMEKAIDWLREKGIAKQAAKAGRIAAEGASTVVVDGNKAIIVEVNSETDFTSRTDKFQHAVEVVAKGLLAANAKTVEEAANVATAEGTVNDVLSAISFSTGEKITLRRFEVVTKNADESFGYYIHMNKMISAVSVIKGSEEVAKDIAMQVASMNPTYIDRDHMPAEIVEKERHTQLEIAKNEPANASKPAEILAKMVEGRVSKALQELSLVDQIYFRDGQTKISAWLKNNNATVTSFIRYGVGDGIEKKVDNWVEEVMNSKVKA